MQDDAETAPESSSARGVRRPLLIGEVLFDCFPNGHSVIGGAPFNVAWNLAGFGCDPLFISAVGDDRLGAQVEGLMTDWGMDRSGVAVLPALPTGRVDVLNPETDPEYRFQADCAWDHLRLEAVAFSPDQHSVLYHGSLAARSEVSRAAIFKLREDPALDVFVDLNLRPPFYDRGALPLLAARSRWLKLNTEELSLLAEALGKTGPDIAGRARAVAQELAVEHMLVTDGKRGAYWIEAADGAPLFEPAPAADPFVDSVGAGDAFASVALFGILQGWQPELILKRAVAFAARVCTVRGATTQNRRFYDNELKEWNQGIGLQ